MGTSNLSTAINSQKPALKRSDFWSPHIQAYQDSGLTQRRFCEDNNLSLNKFTYWYHKLSPERIKGHAKANKKINHQHSSFIPVQVQPQGHGQALCLQIRLPSGIEIVGVTESTVDLLPSVISKL